MPLCPKLHSEGYLSTHQLDDTLFVLFQKELFGSEEIVSADDYCQECMDATLETLRWW